MPFASVNLHPSPVRVIDRAVRAMTDAGWRLWVSAILFFLIPYLLGFFILYKPLIDGSQPYPTGFSLGYMARYYGFIAWYFVVRALNYCTSGQMLYNTCAHEPVTLRHIAISGPRKLLRAAPVYLPVIALAYIGQSLWVVPGLILSYFADFVLPAFILAQLKLIHAWRHGASLRKGRNLALLLSFLLIAGAGYGGTWSLKWLNGQIADHVTFSVASVFLAIGYMVIEVIIQAWMTGLYFSARDQERTDEGMADLFD